MVLPKSKEWKIRDVYPFLKRVFAHLRMSQSLVVLAISLGLLSFSLKKEGNKGKRSIAQRKDRAALPNFAIGFGVTFAWIKQLDFSHGCLFLPACFVFVCIMLHYHPLVAYPPKLLQS